MNQQKPGREMPTGALRLAVQSPEEAHLSHLHDRVLAALRPAGLPLPPPRPPPWGSPLQAVVRVGDRRSHTDPTGPSRSLHTGHAWEPPGPHASLPEPRAAATAAAATGP